MYWILTMTSIIGKVEILISKVDGESITLCHWSYCFFISSSMWPSIAYTYKNILVSRWMEVILWLRDHDAVFAVERCAYNIIFLSHLYSLTCLFFYWYFICKQLLVYYWNFSEQVLHIWQPHFIYQAY